MSTPSLFRNLGFKVVALSVLSVLVGPGCDSPVRPTIEITEPATSQVDVASILRRMSAAGADANRIWGDLSPQAQNAVRDALKTTSVSDSVESGPATASTDGPLAALTTCKSKKISRVGANVFGMKLWAYYQKVDWCYSSGKIVSKFWTRWGEVYAPFWAFNGHIAKTQSGGVGSSSYRVWTQGSFALCMPHVLCTQNRVPWLDLKVLATGSYSYSVGG
jgi:hypothetical protein